MNLHLAPIEKLASVARSSAYVLHALALGLFLVMGVDLLDVLSSDKVGLGYDLSLAVQFVMAIAIPGVMAATALKLSLAVRAVTRR